MDSNNYKVNVTKEACADLDEILEYIAVELSNGSAAQEFANDVSEGVERISVVPLAMPNLNNERFRHLRRLDIKNYVLIYSVNEERREVYILAVLYAKSDVVARLLRRF